MSLRSDILTYIDHIQDEAWLYRIVGHSLSSFKTAMSLLAEMLLEPDQETVQWAGLVVQDLGTLAPLPLRKRMRRLLPSSAVRLSLEANLFRPHHNLRCQAVYVLAKMGCTASLPIIERAFDEFHERDPFYAHRLVFEYRWLGGDTTRMVDIMLRSSSRILRLGLPSRHLFEPLLQDEDDAVRAEAFYWRTRHEALTADIPRGDRRRRYKLAEKQRALVPFSVLEGRFRSHLSLNHQPDFTLDELSAFYESLLLPVSG